MKLGRWSGALFAAGLVVYAIALARDGLVRAPGPHDNDWTLLMWLAKHASWSNLAPLAVGHYGLAQLVLVRVLLPVFGTTLVAAKVMNVLGTVASGWAAYRLQPAFLWGFAAAAAFLLWPEVFLTGQSEFGDPLALGLFAVGLALCFDTPTRTRLIVGGLLIGLSGTVRLHFQTFAWAALLPIGVYFASLKRTGWLALGVFVGQLPMFIINWSVHRTLFSPIAGGFVGQTVVGGANPYDMPATHMLYPMSVVLAEHKTALAATIASRLLECPLPLVLMLAASAVIVFVTHDRRAGSLWLLAVGYYVGFVTPSWGITPRLITPFVLLTVVAAVSALAIVVRGPFVRIAVALCLVLACLNLRLAKSMLRAERTRIVNSWEANRRLGEELRARGVQSPLQVFAADWWTHPVDDPEFIPYYNFGFWNLLVPEFAAERPNPFPYIGDTERFLGFLEEHGVRYVVLARRELLGSLCDERRLPHGFLRFMVDDDRCVFENAYE